MKLQFSTNSRGFSLLEILMVILFVSIILSYATVSYFDVADRSRIMKCRSDLKMLARTCRLFHDQKRSWPSSQAELKFILNLNQGFSSSPDAANSTAPLLDPWGRPYLIDPFFYRVVSKGKNGTLQTLFGGKDGAKDGILWPNPFVRPVEHLSDDLSEQFFTPVFYYIAAGQKIHSCNIDGSRINKNISSVSNLIWVFQKSSYLLYITSGPSYSLWISNIDGSSPRQILSSATPLWNAVSDESSDYIYYTEGTFPDTSVYSIKNTGTGKKLLSPVGTKDWILSLSPYNNRLLLKSVPYPGQGYSLFIMNTDGSNRQQLTSTVSSGNDACFASFSPSGKKIVYTSLPLGTSAVVMDSNGMNQSTVTFTSAVSECFFLEETRLFFRGTDQNFYLANTDGSNTTCISEDFTDKALLISF